MSKNIPYWKQRQEMKLKGPKPSKVEHAEKVEKAKFFAEALKEAPAKCMECDKSLAGSQLINPRTVVAHILPKSDKQGVPSMKTNPLNKVYLCGDCHTDMDTHGCDFISQMKIFPLMLERVKIMWPDIPHNERRRVPQCLKPHE